MNQQKILIFIHMIFALSFLGMLLLHPILIDSLHMDDTVLLANLGWRGVNGLSPVVDYPHFYGGITEQFVTWAFQLFGTTYHSINYAFAMMFVVGVAILWALAWQCLSLTGLALLTALLGALLLSLVPIEQGHINRHHTSHSFMYNHAAILLMMGLAIFSLGNARSRRIEMATALLAGVVVYVLALLKPTFIVYGPCVILACLLRTRWLSAGLVLVGAVAGMLIMDFGMVRFFGSLDHLLQSGAAASTSFRYFVFRTVDIVSAQALAMTIVAFMLLKYHENGIRLLLPVLVLLCGYGTALLTMNSAPDLNLYPFLVVIALLCCDARAEDRKPSGHPATSIVNAVPIVMAYIIILPAFVSATAALALSVTNRSESLISEGPAKGYTVVALGDLKSSTNRMALAESVDDALENIPDSQNEKYEYVMFADGIALLQEIPALKDYGIISNGRMFDFTMPIESRPVVSFPVWPTANLAYFNNKEPLPDDVDAVMISRDWPGKGLLNRELIGKMGTSFRVCRRSKLWTLYVRLSLPDELCSTSN